MDFVFRGAQVIDGTGAAAQQADIAIADDRIVAVGTIASNNGAREIDAKGLTLTPGFIDVHTHDDRAVLSNPTMDCKVSQGVTTVVTGNCGISLAPLSPSETPPAPADLIGDRPEQYFARFGGYLDALDKDPASVNVIAQVGHSTLRMGAMDTLDRAATAADIETVIADHVAAVRRADRIGIDLLEINAAHGYLFHEFLSPITNRRDDRYGGDVDGRLRFLLEAFEAMRAVWPEAKALGVRLSAEDYVEGGWSLEETVELCHRLKTLGCDFATISSGGLVLEQNVPIGEGHQVPLAATVKRETGLVTMAVGMIQRPAHAEAILEAGEADLIALARAMLHDPHWPWHAAALDAEVDFPVQYIRGYKSRWHRGLRKGL